MKKIVLTLFVGIIIIISLKAQHEPLKVELIKINNQYLKHSDNGEIEFSFYIYNIKSENQAKNLEKYIRGYRGVIEFNLIRNEEKNAYLATGRYYEYANLNYFKYLFQLINVSEVFQDNSWKLLENFNTL